MKKKSPPADQTPAPAEVSEETPSQPESGRFPIVGIGASAGGLEALEQFLGHVPADSGMAFVIVQHLDPTSKGIMPELLQRVTTMPVCQVTDRLKIQPDCVYVIPPNKDMCVLHGVLHLLEPAAPRGLRLPIDFFLRSLAEDQQERSIGVILSGMGTDGTLGLRAIKEKAGLVLVQEPASAKFDGMPRSAIDAGTGGHGRPRARVARKDHRFSSARSPGRRPDRAGPGGPGPERSREDCGPAARCTPATTSRCTRRAPSTAASSGAWASTRSTRSPPTSAICRRIPRNWICSSRSC